VEDKCGRAVKGCVVKECRTDAVFSKRMEGKVRGEVVFLEVCRQRRELFPLDEIEESVRMGYDSLLFDPFQFV